MEELVSIVLGLGALALPVVCLVCGGKPSRYAAGSFLLWGLALLAQLAILGVHAQLEHAATLYDTAWPRFLAAALLLCAVAAVNGLSFWKGKQRE